jgi:ferrous iron transport protein A
MTAVSMIEMVSGSRGRVVRIGGGRGMVARLSSLGIVPGAEVTMVNRYGRGGPVVIEVGRSQVAVGRGMAGRILIDSIETPA